MIQKDFRKRKADRKESYEEIKTFTDKFDDYGTDGCRNADDGICKAGLALGYGDRVGGRHCHGCGLRGGFIRAEHPCAEGAGKYHENIDGARSHREQQSG